MIEAVPEPGVEAWHEATTVQATGNGPINDAVLADTAAFRRTRASILAPRWGGPRPPYIH